MASSTIVHVPSSFPPEIPSSPPARLSDIEESDADYKPSLDGDFMDEDQGDNQSDPENGDDNDNACRLENPHAFEYEEDWGMAQEIDMFYEDSARQTSTPLATWGNPSLSVPSFTFVPTTTMPYPTSLSPSDSEAPSHRLCDTTTPPLDSPAINTWSHSRSTSASSSITSATAVLSQTPDWQKLFPELLGELNDLWAQVRQKDAALLAANAHCTIIQRCMADANKQIENLTKKKTRTSTKVKACFGTLPELKAAFEEEEAQRLEQERLNAEKEAQKTAETAVRNARIATDTILRTFDNSLSAYKRKDDLLTIAGALQIVTTGTVPQLTARIKEHLHAHPDLVSNPRFAGLFGQRHANISGSHSEPTMTVPAASLLPTPSHSYSSSVPLNQQLY
ncbi:hypothetical protein JOM56_013052 [Amanita muscaria]